MLSDKEIPGRLRNPDFIGAIFWLAMGLLLTLWSVTYSFGEINRPGPGFFPFCLGLLLIILSTALAVKGAGAFSGREESPPGIPLENWKRVALVVVILLAAGFLFEDLGYLITLFLMVFLSMRVGGGPQSWKKVLLVAFLATTAVHLVFVLLLKQLLPAGILGS